MSKFKLSALLVTEGAVVKSHKSPMALASSYISLQF